MIDKPNFHPLIGLETTPISNPNPEPPTPCFIIYLPFPYIPKSSVSRLEEEESSSTPKKNRPWTYFAVIPQDIYLKGIPNDKPYSFIPKIS